MDSKFWLINGLLLILVSFLAAIYFVNQIMSEMIKAQTDGTVAPNLDFNAAVLGGIFVGVGFVFVIIGLIKRMNQKKIANQ